MSPTSHPSTLNTAGGNRCTPVGSLRCPTPMTVISDATKFGRLERRNALWVEDGVLHEGRNMKLGLFLMTKFGLDLFSACYFLIFDIELTVLVLGCSRYMMVCSQ